MNRRNFVKGSYSGLLYLAIGGSAFTMTGCNVFDDILAWVPVGLTALEGITTVLGPLLGPGAAAVITIIKAGFADLSAAVSEYRSDTNPADKATLLARIRTFLSDIVNNFQSFLNALNLGNNPIINIVIGLVDVVLAAIEGFMGQLPPAPVGTKPVPKEFKLGTQVHVIVPKFYKSVGDFKRDYNSIATTNGHPEVIIH